jgi:hypothetical protein
MVGKIFITRSGYDPQLGKHVKDPYLGDGPTMGACRPDIRKQLTEGDHIFVISGKLKGVNQFVMGGFEIERKINACEAYDMFPDQRLSRRGDGQLTGNIIVDATGHQHELDDHKSFENRIQNYIVGANPLALSSEEEVAEGRKHTLEALRAILRKDGESPFEIVGRFGTRLTENQIEELRTWLTSLKAAAVK